MTDFVIQTFEQENTRMGDFFSWWITSAPKDGEYWHLTKLSKGQMPSNSRHKRSPDGKYRTGGAWLMEKRSTTWSGDRVTTFRVGSKKAYSGTYCFTTTTDNEVIWPAVSIEGALSDAESFGAQAWAALKADRPDFSPVTSLLELKEMPGLYKQLLGSAKRKVRDEQMRRAYGSANYQNGKLLKSIYRNGKVRYRNKWWLTYAGEYTLMVEFGLVPLMKDIKNFLQAFNGRKKRFDQLLRDEGKPVRRSKTLHKQNEGHAVWGNDAVYPTSYGNPSIKPIHVSQCYGIGARTTTALEKHRTVWCAGSSYYSLPPGPRDEAWKSNIMRRIMGARITPSQLYNAIPWTWMIDYFTGLGDFMEAVSPGIGDRSVLKYAYIMDKRHAIAHTVGTQRVYTNPQTHSEVRAIRDNKHVRKARVAASPFGWGIKKENLSPFQWAILGALGASKL